MDRITFKDFGYAEVFVFKNFLITQIAEGIVVGEGHVRYLKMFIEKTYGSNPMVYLSNRVNSYSVNPLVYHHFPEIPNLLGIGVVAYSPLTIQNIRIEKKFSKVPFQAFDKIEQAVIWSDYLVTAHIKKHLV